MSGADSSIYFKQKQFDPVGGMAKGVRLSQMMAQSGDQNRQRKQEAAKRDAFKNNVVENEDGTQSLNKKAVLSDLMRINPETSMEYEDKFASQNHLKSKRANEVDKVKFETGKRIMFSIQDEGSYQNAKALGAKNGFPVEDWPETYDPQFVKQKQLGMLNYKEQTARQTRAEDVAHRNKVADSTQSFRNKQLEIRKSEAVTKAKRSGATKGVEAVDKDYAKQYNKYTATGRTNAINTIEKLDKLAEEVGKDTGLGEAGGTRWPIPDAFRARLSIERRDDARNFANKTLKELFGGQLSDAEREAAAREYWNDSLDNKSNYERLKGKIKELRDNVKSQDAKARYFQEKKTLDGFRFKPSESVEQKRKTGQQTVLKTDQIDWAD